MWQKKYALAVPKNLEVGVDFWPCSEGDFLTGCPYSVVYKKNYFVDRLTQLSKYFANSKIPKSGSKMTNVHQCIPILSMIITMG